MDVTIKASLKFETDEGIANRRAIEARIAQLCGQLESVDLDYPKTQSVRGAIKELRSLLAPPMPHVSTPVYSGMDFHKRREGTA